MKVLICPDSFKNCLPAADVAEYLARGIRSEWSNAEIRHVPLADGGEGTVRAVVSSGGRLVTCSVHDPLMRTVTAEYGILADNTTAVIEMSAASGIELLSSAELNPLKTTTYGTGELIKSALDYGCRRIVLGIGGSATNDCGAGMFQALGGNILNADGTEVDRGGASLAFAERLDFSSFDERVQETEFIVACDVQNPLLGEFGASSVFAPQKGATAEHVLLLEDAVSTFHALLEKTYQKSFSSIPGAGAAGGLGAGAMAFLGGRLSSGFSIIADVLQLRNHIEWADVVVTGEGKTDSQTIQGKVPWGVIGLARTYNKPVVSVAGTVDGSADVLTREYPMAVLLPIVNGPVALDDALRQAPDLLYETGCRIARFLSIGGQICRL